MARESRLQVRMEEDLFEKVERFAADAGVSSNQLTRGLLRWLVERGKAGKEPYRDANGKVQDRDQQGCVWVGTRGEFLSHEERCRFADLEGCLPEDVVENKGEILFCLDFTERRVVRDDFEQEKAHVAKPAKPKRKR